MSLICMISKEKNPQTGTVFVLISEVIENYPKTFMP